MKEKEQHRAQINIDAEAYFGLEYIAKNAIISVNELINNMANEKCAQFMKENNLTKIPLTPIRKAKQKG